MEIKFIGLLPEKLISLVIPVVGLSGIVSLEFILLHFELFKYLPYIGVLFHLAGGYWIAMLSRHIFSNSIIQLPPFVKGLFLLGCVGLAAISWEVFEYAISHNAEIPMNQSVAEIIEDLLVGLSGGISYIIIWNRKG